MKRKRKIHWLWPAILSISFAVHVALIKLNLNVPVVVIGGDVITNETQMEMRSQHFYRPDLVPAPDPFAGKREGENWAETRGQRHFGGERDKSQVGVSRNNSPVLPSPR